MMTRFIGMERLMKFWSATYYTEPVALLVLIVLFVISLFRRKDLPGAKFFPAYFFSFILLMACDLVVIGFSVNRGKNLYPLYVEFLYDLLVTCLEIIALSGFLNSVIKSTRLRKVLMISRVVLLSWIAIIIVSKFTQAFAPEIFIQQNRIYIFEAVFFLSILTFYFLELFKQPRSEVPTKDPSFWIACGMVLYFLGTLPYSLVTNYLLFNSYDLYAKLYALVYISYIIMFILIIKGYLCLQSKKI